MVQYNLYMRMYHGLVLGACEAFVDWVCVPPWYVDAVEICVPSKGLGNHESANMWIRNSARAELLSGSCTHNISR